jgi:hypothetical protein
MGFPASQAMFAAALLDPARPTPRGVTSARGEADAARFAVYRNNVFVGLARALAKRFPVTERLVGADFFAGMARIYAGLEKPISPLLFDYGETFPGFVEAFEPAKGVPYLADVARIEAAWSRAYHAADAAPLDVAGLAAIDPAKLSEARLVPHPSAALISSAHPAGTIWAAHQQAEVTPVSEWKPETVLVVRPAMDVSVRVLPAQDVAFASALFRGDTLSAAAEEAFAAHASFDFGAALVGLVSLGAFRTITIDEDVTWQPKQ